LTNGRFFKIAQSCPEWPSEEDKYKINRFAWILEQKNKAFPVKAG